MSTRRDGICIWFTGQSGGGKSTTAGLLQDRLEGLGMTVSVLDVIPELAKSWWERTSEGKLARKAFVASQIVHHGGAALAVTVSTRASVLEHARTLVGHDRFVEVRVKPPPEVATARKAARQKRQKLHKRLRRRLRQLRAHLRAPKDIKAPEPDLEIDTEAVDPEQAADLVLRLLVERNLVPSPPARSGSRVGQG